MGILTRDEIIRRVRGGEIGIEWRHVTVGSPTFAAPSDAVRIWGIVRLEAWE